jgi:hypothetical protein
MPDTTIHPDTLKLQRLELRLMQAEARIRILQEALAVGATMCPLCGTNVVIGR